LLAERACHVPGVPPALLHCAHGRLRGLRAGGGPGAVCGPPFLRRALRWLGHGLCMPISAGNRVRLAGPVWLGRWLFFFRCRVVVFGCGRRAWGAARVSWFGRGRFSLCASPAAEFVLVGAGRRAFASLPADQAGLKQQTTTHWPRASSLAGRGRGPSPYPDLPRDGSATSQEEDGPGTPRASSTC
jgi:hypothetical protein